MPKQVKILVVGEVKGAFSALSEKFDAVAPRTFFDCVFCLGDFFDNDLAKQDDLRKLKSGEISFPFNTLIMEPSSENLQSHFDVPVAAPLAENVFCLGKLGIWRDKNDFFVVFVSGREAKKASSCTFTSEEIDNLIFTVINHTHYKGGVDLLLTSQFPKGVERFTGNSLPDEVTNASSEAIARLAKSIKPRYHFSSMNGYVYDRATYRNHQVLQETPCHVTHFIGFGQIPYPCTRKEIGKSMIRGFSLEPLAHTRDMKALCAEGAGTTANPYDDSVDGEQFSDASKRPRIETEYRYAKNVIRETGEAVSRNEAMQMEMADAGENRKRRAPKLPPMRESECWFCLSSPKVAKHLLAWLGSTTYLAMAKGPLLPEHCLLLPVDHVQAMARAGEAEQDEISTCIDSLTRMYAARDWVPFVWERNYRVQHFQLQICPVKLEWCTNDALVNEFVAYAKKEEIDLREVAADAIISQLITVPVPYFYIELPTTSADHPKQVRRRKFLYMFERGMIGKFPMNLGRDYLAEKWRLQSRVDWRKCTQTEDEETQTTMTFREKIEPFFEAPFS